MIVFILLVTLVVYSSVECTISEIVQSIAHLLEKPSGFHGEGQYLTGGFVMSTFEVFLSSYVSQCDAPEVITS